ncbi:FNBP1 protein, partial [Polypterus senegalus]
MASLSVGGKRTRVSRRHPEGARSFSRPLTATRAGREDEGDSFPWVRAVTGVPSGTKGSRAHLARQGAQRCVMSSGGGMVAAGRGRQRQVTQVALGLLLQDQFENLEKHTQWGIDFVDKYTKFVKERCEIEISYAKQIRYSSCRAFLATLNELNDYAGQHEVIAENLTSQIVSELARYTQELKQERKSHFHDGRRAQQHIENSWKQLEACKRRFERDCKEADRAQQYFEKMDNDINVTKADVEKWAWLGIAQLDWAQGLPERAVVVYGVSLDCLGMAVASWFRGGKGGRPPSDVFSSVFGHLARQQAQLRHQMAADSKADYSACLQKFNQEQNEHYYTLIPHIFQVGAERVLAARAAARPDPQSLPPSVYPGRASKIWRSGGS